MEVIGDSKGSKPKTSVAKKSTSNKNESKSGANKQTVIAIAPVSSPFDLKTYLTDPRCVDIRPLLPSPMPKSEHEILKAIDGVVKNQVVVDVDLLVMDLPKVSLEAIVKFFPRVEIIEEVLYFKCDGYLKTVTQTYFDRLIHAAQPGWASSQNLTLRVGAHVFLPDYCSFNVPIPLLQIQRPAIHGLVMPNLWVEVAYNNGADRQKAFNSIAYAIGFCPNTEFVCVVLKNADSLLPTPNPNPAAVSVHSAAVPAQPLNGPYIVHWGVGVAYNNPTYYRVVWNEHLVLGVGVTVEFGDIFDRFLQIQH